jgi:hypothetical protein
MTSKFIPVLRFSIYTSINLIRDAFLNINKFVLILKVNLSHKIKADMNVKIQYDVPLYPIGNLIDLLIFICKFSLYQEIIIFLLYLIVVESTTNQSFITRKMVKKLNKTAWTFSASSFSTDLCNILQERSLYIDRESMDIKQLELLINNGFKADNELLKPFYDAISAAKSRREKKIDQAKRTMDEDAEIITKMGWRKSYR